MLERKSDCQAKDFLPLHFLGTSFSSELISWFGSESLVVVHGHNYIH